MTNTTEFVSGAEAWARTPRSSEAPPQTDETCRPRRLLTVGTDSGRCSSRVTMAAFIVARTHHRTQAGVLGPVLSATLDEESTTRLHEAGASTLARSTLPGPDRPWPRIPSITENGASE